jgi:hypothetical protein
MAVRAARSFQISGIDRIAWASMRIGARAGNATALAKL